MINEHRDELYAEAVDFVVQTNQTSIVRLQRRLRVDFFRAARLLDVMESEGLISRPPNGGVRVVIRKEAAHG